jgi:hypothetical protein
MSAVRIEKQSGRASRVVPFPPTTSRRPSWTSFGSVGAIAAAVLFMVLIIWIIVLWQQNRALRRDMDLLASEIQLTQQEARRSSEFVTLLSSPGARVAQLRGSDQASAASGQLAYDRSGRAMLLATGLPPAPPGKEYQLWFIVGQNAPIPGRTFATDNIGRGELEDRVPPRAMESAVFAITLEPACGSTSPTGAIYLRSTPIEPHTD